MTERSVEPMSSRRSLRLTIVTPLQVVLDIGEVRHVRAEDATGSFGILPGHVDFLTVLSVSVLIYRLESENTDQVADGVATGREHFVGLRGGVLLVTEGQHVQVFTREATQSDNLRILSTEVKSRLSLAAALEAEAHKSFSRMEGSLLSHMTDYLRHEQRSGGGGSRRLPGES